MVCRNTKGASPVVGMMNFGAPRVGNKAFAEHYNSTVAESFRVVDQHDVIHLLPPLYTHTGGELLCRQNGEAYVDGELIEDIAPNAVVRTREVKSFLDFSFLLSVSFSLPVH